MIGKLNRIINGWYAYYRIGVSKRVFNALDAHAWKLVYKWARFTHSNKSRRWVTARYFGEFNWSRRDRWVFGIREAGDYLRKFAWTPIVRHRMVAGTASPDDPTLTDYWTRRRRRSNLPVDTTTQRLLRAKQGRCPICRDLLLHADHEPRARKSGNNGSPRPAKRSADTRSPSGQREHRTNASPPDSYIPTATAGSPATAATQPLPPHPRAFRACLSRLPGKRARPVLRGPRRSSAPGLPDEAEFAAVRYFALNGTDHRSHAEQDAALGDYIRWRNQRAKPKTPFATNSKIRHLDYPFEAA